MKIRTLLLTFFVIFALGGCTQVVTAPIHIAGAAASATLDVAGSAVGAVTHAVSGDE